MNQVIGEQPYIDGITQRKPAAFSAFYDRYAPAFYGEIKRVLHEPGACEETLQQAFYAIWTSINTYDHTKERFFTWAFKIVRRKASTKKIDMALHEIFACQQLPAPLCIGESATALK
jgi:RNA polymerase sigma-70 factor (ECF subfamily)